MASAMIKIGPYLLGETLGVGSFGKVKLATHEPTGIKVGVKILNRKKIASLDMVQKIRREIQFLKVLRHPHIIRLYEVISTPTDIFMVMEYVSGGELFDYIVKHGRMSERDARKRFQQLICAVDSCHRHKIVHRDLKPENLLLDANGDLKIADFGLSNIMTDGDFLRTSCGSPNYAAPEVISGKLYAGAEVDVWSCGVILYALLCGKLPFDDEYIPTLFKKIKGGIFSIPGYLSLEARELLLSMLIVDPLQRITIEKIKESAWFRIDLPEYLTLPPERLDEEYAKEDSVVVAELSARAHADRQKTGVDEAGIRASLKLEDDNPVKVAYHLLADKRRLARDGTDRTPPDDSGSSTEGVADRSLTDVGSGRGGMTRSIEIPGGNLRLADLGASDGMRGSLPAGSLPMSRSLHADSDLTSPSSISMLSTSIKGGLSFGDAMSAQEKKRKKRSKWHLGIRSRSLPHEIMAEVFAAMRSLGMDWKLTDSLYHIYGRYRHPSNRYILVSLQLYKVDDRNYLLDFKNVGESDGFSLFDFFTVCSLLITELAISA